MKNKGDLAKHEIVCLLIIGCLIFLPKVLNAVYYGHAWLEKLSSGPLWYVCVVLLIPLGAFCNKFFDKDGDSKQ